MSSQRARGTTAGRPGRPSGSDRGDVPRALLTALEQALRTNSHLTLTTRDIAARAGVHHNMIRYYFGGLEGMYVTLIDRVIEAAHRELTEAEAAILDHPDPTRLIVRAMTDIYYARPADRIGSILLIEAQRPESTFLGGFSGRQRWRLFRRLERMMRKLVVSGHYRTDLNTFDAAQTMLSLVAAPLTIGRFMQVDRDDENVFVSGWADSVARIIDQQCR